MSGTVYTSTLSFAINAFLSNQLSRKTLFNGTASLGTNTLNMQRNQLAVGSSVTYNSITGIFAIFTDNPLSLIISGSINGNILNNKITAISILEGAFSSIVVTNTAGSANPANIVVFYE